MAKIDEEIFTGNSLKSKEKNDSKLPEKKIRKVINGEVKTRKKPLLSRLAGMIFSNDRGSIKDYLVLDVFVPCIKDTTMDIMSMIFYGRKSGSKSGRIAGSGTKVSYASYYKDDRDDRRRERERDRSTKGDDSVDDILFETRSEAQEVLTSLADIIDEYGSASVADLCDLCGVTESWADHKYGWTNVSKATIESVRGGYFIINLPKARQIG